MVNGFDFRGAMATMVRIQYPESLEDPKIYEWIYAGTIDEPSFAEGTFSCKLQTVFPQVQCPNRGYQLACNSEFGDAECGYRPAEMTAVVTGVKGNKLTVRIKVNDAYWNSGVDMGNASNYWKNGVITIAGESRIIENSYGESLTINVNFLQDNIVGKVATLKQGCDKSHERCAYYGNTIHYGGFPAIPFESVWR